MQVIVACAVICGYANTVPYLIMRWCLVGRMCEIWCLYFIAPVMISDSCVSLTVFFLVMYKNHSVVISIASQIWFKKTVQQCLQCECCAYKIQNINNIQILRQRCQLIGLIYYS